MKFDEEKDDNQCHLRSETNTDLIFRKYFFFTWPLLANLYLLTERTMADTVNTLAMMMPRLMER